MNEEDKRPAYDEFNYVTDPNEKNPNGCWRASIVFAGFGLTCLVASVFYYLSRHP